MHRVENGLGLSAGEVCDALNKCYEGYVVPFHIPVEFAAAMNRVESVDLNASLFVREKKEIVAVALIARRGNQSRLAGFAVAPKRRGTGLGKWLMGKVLEQAKARGDSSMNLEVIIGNEAAERLYESVGFEHVCRLRGYVKAQEREERREEREQASLREVNISEVARAILNDEKDWPWQQSAASVIQLTAPHRGWRWKRAFTCTSDPNAATVVLRGFAGEGEELLSLIRALRERFPKKSWRVIPTIPEGIYVGAFEEAGFEVDELAQYWMRWAPRA